MRNLRRIREHGFKDGVKAERERILKLIDEMYPAKGTDCCDLMKLKQKLKGA